jgi:hypothetical protein
VIHIDTIRYDIEKQLRSLHATILLDIKDSIKYFFWRKAAMTKSSGVEIKASKAIEHMRSQLKPSFLCGLQIEDS